MVTLEATACYLSVLIIASFRDVLIPAEASKRTRDVTRSRDSPRYNLLASDDEYGPVWKTDMNEMPVVYMQPAHSTVKLRCDADGKPRPNTKWYKDGEDLPSRPFGKTEQRRCCLRLRNLMTFDSGNYTCVVSNRHGQLRHTYSIEVFARDMSVPRITKAPRNRTVEVGDNVTLHCRFHSDIEAYVEWFKLRDDVDTARSSGQSQPELDTGWNSFVMIQTGLDYGVTHPTKLVLNNVSLSDAGKYACRVTNRFGDVNSSAVLTVLQPTITSVIKEKLYVTGSRHLYVIIVAALSAPLLITTVIVTLILVHRRRWVNWRKRSLAKEALSAIHVHRQQSLTSQALQQSLQPDDERWEINPAMIEEHELLGEGAFGQVYKATIRGLPGAMKLTVAIKKLKVTANDAEVRAFVNEVDVMKSVGRHVNVVAFIGCCTKLGQGDGVLRMAVEFARHGNLRDFLRRNQPVGINCRDVSSSCSSSSTLSQCQRCLDESASVTPSCHRIPLTSRHLLSFAHQAARGMQFIASNKIIHRDLAARNVLVADRLVLKIADFGLTRVVDFYQQRTDPFSRVPMKWMAPESLTYSTYTTNSDVWSYGVLLWEIFAYGETPYQSVPVESLSRLLQTGYRMTRPRFAPHNIYEIMLRCWALKPNDRPSFTKLTQALDSLLTKASSTKYLQLDVGDDANQGSATIESVSSGSSCDTESSIVEPQSSDDRSDGHTDAPRTVAEVRHEPPHHHLHHHHQQQQQQQQQESLLSCQLSSAYNDRSQLLLTPITE